MARNEFSAAKPLLDHLAFAEDHYKISSVQFLVEATQCDYYEIVKFLKNLDAHGLGQFIVGRKGKDSRIEWKYHPQSLGGLLLSSSAVLQPIPQDLEEYDGGIETIELIEHSFFLRPDYNVKIQLPSDFNRSDQNRFEKWLDTIPFD